MDRNKSVKRILGYLCLFVTLVIWAGWAFVMGEALRDVPVKDVIHLRLVFGCLGALGGVVVARLHNTHGISLIGVGVLNCREIVSLSFCHGIGYVLLTAQASQLGCSPVLFAVLSEGCVWLPMHFAKASHRNQKVSRATVVVGSAAVAGAILHGDPGSGLVFLATCIYAYGTRLLSNLDQKFDSARNEGRFPNVTTSWSQASTCYFWSGLIWLALELAQGETRMAEIGRLWSTHMMIGAFLGIVVSLISTATFYFALSTLGSRISSAGLTVVPVFVVIGLGAQGQQLSAADLITGSIVTLSGMSLALKRQQA